MNPSGENLTEPASGKRPVGIKTYADSAVPQGQKMAPLLYYQGYGVQKCLPGCGDMRNRGPFVTRTRGF